MTSEWQRLIRDVPDFPKPGILFKDITPLLAHPEAWKTAIAELAEPYKKKQIQQVVCVESRGFLVGTAVAALLGAGLVPVRKPGKLPAAKLRAEYALEYGTDSLEIHADAFKPGTRVLIVDDVLATGGTTAAVRDLVGRLGGELVGAAFLIELAFLKGREKVAGLDVQALIKY
ncbi:MAG: adenine phosphoribosyltransferase [candidate division FCPU426 bacterium]